MTDINSVLMGLSKKLNTSPEELENAAGKGDLSDIIKNSGQAERINSILSDPEKTRELLKSEQAQKLMKLFGNE